MKDVRDCSAVEDNVVPSGGAIGDHAAILIQQLGGALVVTVVETVNGIEAERGTGVGRDAEPAHLKKHFAFRGVDSLAAKGR